jgi:asparagine synthase (glutamine-hydrolysing)
MGRMLGVVDGTGSGDPGALLETMRDRLCLPRSAPGTFRKSVRGAAALGLVSTGRSFAAGIGAIDAARCIVSYCGFMSGIERVFRENGLDPSADACANLAALYRSRGVDFLKLLPGMFMIAVYDAERNTLLLAGDRSGYFPLYYSNEPARFAFASSINPLVALLSTKRINKAAVVEHLVFDALYGSVTFYDGVEILPFGTYLTVDCATRRLERGTYFRYEELFDAAEYRGNRRIDAPAELTRRLAAAVGRVIEGRDVATFGLSCGGGIDCSFLGGILKELGAPLPIFCTHVSEGRLSEGDMAKAAADHLGVALHVSTLETKDFYPGVLKSIANFGQPIVHPNTAKFHSGARRTISLGRVNQVYGVASDLLFGGFGNVISYYRYLRASALFGALPPRVRSLVGSVMADPVVANLNQRIRNSFKELAGVGVGNFDRAAMQHGIESAYAAIEDPGERALKVLMLENLCDYQQHLLNRRAELAASYGLALFFPFLDLDVVHFAVNLPTAHCVDWRTSKIVVRKAARPYLGPRLAARKKYGGDVPVERWVSPLAFLLEDGFVREQLRFDAAALNRILAGSPKLLWNMIDIELWGRLCILGERPETLLDALRARGIECAPFDSIGG